MKRLYITSVFRRPDERGKTGCIYALDYNSKQVINKLFTDTDSVRGLCFHREELWVAGFYNTLSIIDLDSFQFKETKKYVEIKYLHLIYDRDDYLWVTSTGNQRIVKLQDWQIIDSISLGDSDTDTLHFNSIGWAPSREEYHIYNGTHQVFNFTTKSVVFSGLDGPHDIGFLDENNFIVNESVTRKALLINLISKEAQCIHTITPRGPDTSENLWGFTRGLAISKDFIILGSAPADLHFFNKDFEKQDMWQLSENPDESIFDICLDPRDWR